MNYEDAVALIEAHVKKLDATLARVPNEDRMASGYHWMCQEWQQWKQAFETLKDGNDYFYEKGYDQGWEDCDNERG